MRRTILVVACLTLMIPFTSLAATGTWALWDWSAYADGVTFNPPALPPGVDDFFSYVTGLGSLQFTFNTSGTHTVGVYFNPYYDTGYGNLNTGQGIVHGSPASGLTYGMDDPDLGNLWADFSGNNLTNYNLITTYAPPGGEPDYTPPCCNIGWAELLSFSLNPGDTGTVTFAVSQTDPLTGFYLEAQDGQELQSIFMSTTYDYVPAETQPSVPEPGTWLLIGAGLCSLAGVRRKLATKS